MVEEEKETLEPAQDFTLVWYDEFDYQGLPDETKWGYEEGLVRNSEEQFFTKSRIENAEVKGGHLHIKAIQEDYKGAKYSSASLHTNGTFDFTYGRVEVRAKVPKGRGVWPAIWTLGSNINEVGWPKCGEIDIMEYVGFMPDTIHGTIHTQSYNHMTETDRGGKYQLVDPWAEFHEYAMEWYPDSIHIYVDDQKYFTQVNDGSGIDSWPFQEASQYLIINLAIGGTWGGMQGVDESIFPQELIVDYVRIYEYINNKN